ncbi:hypothetical protein H5410_037066 [Solanum commersonii]|uniref:Endonuclease/exonuclease/phosphatase domain-containing protein n=1 Tax=Solanum commersonii TaxID=4109 RepID=A0A9J5Y6Z5_SOLCO|nr:hypothetical protein H5410_037066 [Solanum commersonii]
MINVICLNARSINTQGSLEKFKYLKKIHNLSMIAILEPFADNIYLNNYKIHLNMDSAACNSNGKIWLFWNTEMNCDVLEIDDQHITCVLHHVEYKDKFMISFIYAKCKDHLRRPLCDRLIHYSNIDNPWCTIGDFNVITSTEEKQGELPYNMNKSFEFISFTWCNQGAEESRVWKRLDRAMGNDKWLEDMPQTTINHLPFVGPDHCPLLMEIVVRNEQPIKYFKFLHYWTDHESFNYIVKDCWDREVQGNPMWKLHQKMKSTVKEFEERVQIAEEEVIINNNEENRATLHCLNAKYIKYMKMLNMLHQYQSYKSFQMEVRGPQINHFSLPMMPSSLHLDT